MKRSTATIVIAALILGFLLSVGISNVAPGPISATHHAHPDLQSNRSCHRCHGSGGKTLADACGDCHPGIKEQVASSTGFHGTNAQARLPNCGECHFEHLGRDSPLIGDRAFIRAGFAGARAFRHESLDFRLEGRHVTSKCDGCHELAFEPHIATGERRFSPLSQNCTDCHADPHDGKLSDCNGCHGQDAPFKAVTANFVHDKRVPLIGGHAQVDCIECHTAEQVTRGLERGASQTRPVRACTACHEHPHSGGFVQGIDARGASCGDCHLPEHSRFTSADWERGRAFHDASGFRLAPNHEKVACDACHPGLGTADSRDSDMVARFKRRFPGNRLQTDCAACHADPHDGQFVNADASPERCSDCHEGQFVPHLFDRARHERTAFPLRGSHRDVACDRCHILEFGRRDPKRFPRVRRFVGTKTDCASCHESPHPGGQFSAALAADSDCKACHSEDRFRPALLTVEQHARTRFPLLGAHRAVACNHCHEPRTAGAATISDVVFHGTSRKCQDCHVDVHDKQFDRPGVPRIVSGKTSCERCHTSGTFELDRAQRFRHGFWTGFALDGAHATASCSACHPKGEPTHGGLRTMARASRECAKCHEDPHGGQLQIKGKTDCSRCHDTRPGWNPARFDHDRDSRFELDGNHENLACTKCHQAFRGRNGSRIVRFKPLGVTCKSCHAWENGRR